VSTVLETGGYQYPWWAYQRYWILSVSNSLVFVQ